MEAIFQSEFIEDLSYWVKEDRKVALKILKLVKAILKSPTDGIGKPERLKYIDNNVWSRRITQEHRIVYYIHSEKIEFLQCRYHY